MADVAEPAGSFAWPSLGLLDHLRGERLELADQFAQAFGVVEQRLIALELRGAERSGDGLGVHLSDPRWVWTVELVRVAVASASRRAAACRALHEASGKAEAELGDLGDDLALAAFGVRRG